MKINASKYKISFCCLAMVVISLTFGCKKDKEPSDPMTLLTAKKWRVVYKDGNPSTNPKTKYFYYAELPCTLDDTYQYNRDGKRYSDGGNIKCEPSEPREITIDYSVDFTKMELTQFGTTMKILELTPTRLKLASPLPPPNEWGILMFEH